jgi:molybdopterin-guanine dinucleotide biosynthesis protein A
MDDRFDIGAFILAGGKSSRMGASKPLLQIEGETMLARAVRLASSLAMSCMVIGPPSLREHIQVEVAEDEYPGCGPLGGIATALRLAVRNSPSQTWNLILACDMPYLTHDWLRYLVQRALASQADVVIAANDPCEGRGPQREQARRLEPLCGMYRSTSGAAITAAVERGVRKVTDGFAGLKVELVEPAEWKCFDSGGGLFKNVNTPEDYQAAKAFFEA